MNKLEEQNLLGSGNFLERLKAGLKDRFSEGREDYRQAYYATRELQGLDPEDAKIKTTLATNPTFVTARDMLNISEPTYRGQRQERGMGLSNDLAIRTGQVLGTLGNDIVQDSTRGLYWLMNAAQAVGNVTNEYVLSKSNPGLFSHDKTEFQVPVMDNGKPKVYANQGYTDQNRRKYDAALKAGLISPEGIKQKGVGMKGGRYTRRKYDPGDVALLGAATGVAINGGLGLLNPLGGSGGYTAAIESAEDPTKTANVLLEVAAKYFMGRTGDLLPYDEFSKYRPDVSKGDYNKYKAFKYDKREDWNPTDGDFTLLNGLLKGTTEGIHGPELQMLGRSLPATTTLTPFLGALAGGAIGVRNKRPIRGGTIGGFTGLAAGGTAGIIAEEMRRRASSNRSQQQGGNAEQYLG